MYLTPSGVGWPAGGAAQGISVAAFTAEYRMTPSKRSLGYCWRRAARPEVNHDGGEGCNMLVEEDNDERENRGGGMTRY
jgi:hypothetical protein